MRMNAFGVGLLVAAAMLLIPLVSTAKIYKWTDANGVTHYSEDPPPEAVAEMSTMASASPSSGGHRTAAPLSDEVLRKLRAVRVPADPLP